MKQKVIVSFSGGKDSTWMLLEMIRRNEHIDEVVFFDTGWEFPQMMRHVERIKKLVEDKGIKFTTLHPKKSFDYYMFDHKINKRSGEQQVGRSWCGYGGCRWGTREKIAVINKYFKSQQNYVQCIGIAADELDRLEKEYNENKRFPLVEWGVTEAECLEGCYSLGYDWGGVYDNLTRVSCKFCSLMNLSNARSIWAHYPEVWDELKQYQRNTYLPFKGEGKSVFDLEVRFELEKEFEGLDKPIRGKEFFNELKNRLQAKKEDVNV